MVKTYDCTDGGAQHCLGCYTMRESTDGFGKSDEYGDWVRKEDYDALAAELAALRTEFTENQIKHYRRADELKAALDLANTFLANRAYTQHHMREQWASNPAGVPLLESLDRVYSAPETSVQSAPHDWYCPNCDCDLCGAVQGRLERTAVETKGEQG